MYYGENIGQRLGESMVEVARKAGIPVYGSVTLQFANNDVPEFLKNLHRFEEASRKAGKDIKAVDYLPQPAYA